MSTPGSIYARNALRFAKTNKSIPGRKQAWRKPVVQGRKPKNHSVLRHKGTRSVGDTRIPSARTDGQTTRLSNHPVTSRRLGKSDAPSSIEAEHRHIIGVSNKASTDLRNFRKTYKMNKIDFSKCASMAREILTQLEKEESSIQTSSDLFVLLDSKLIDPKLRTEPEFEHLEILCEKQKRFSDIFSRTKHKLSVCFLNHLAKYCVSFMEETGGIHIKVICDYEDKIVEMKKTLENSFQECNDMFDEYLLTCKPFIGGYLENSEKLQEKVDHMIKLILDACDTMKAWVKLDKDYPPILWDEIIDANVDRDKTVNAQKKVARKQENEAQIVHRKELARDKLHQKLTDIKIEKRKLKQRMENLADRQLQTDKELEDKKEELEKVNNEINNRKSNSPKYFERLTDKQYLLQQQIAKVEERLEMLDRQDHRYAKLDKEFDYQIEDLQDDLDAQNAHIDNHRHKLREFESEIAQNAHTLKMKNETISIAKKIREMKLSPQTLRKIYFQKMENSTTKDLLQEACKIVAMDIGRDWEALYLDIKFLPKRTKDKREKDVEAIKLHSVQREKTTKMLAFLSLQKWRIFNKHASIEDMVKSLRRIEKFAIAHRLEHRFMKSATAKT